MAVTHAFGFARDLNLNCPTETSTFVHHQSPRLALTTGSQPVIGSPGRTSRTSPSVMPQLARVAAGMCPTTSKTASAAFADFATASVALSSSPIATKNHCSIERPSALTYLVNKRTTRPSVFCCIATRIWLASTVVRWLVVPMTAAVKHEGHKSAADHERENDAEYHGDVPVNAH